MLTYFYFCVKMLLKLKDHVHYSFPFEHPVIVLMWLQACSFILATPDTLKYSTLYDTLVDLLAVTAQVGQK